MAATDHEPIELRSLVAHTLADMAHTAYAKHIELALEEGEALHMEGNPTQLGVLLRNLVDNAIRYTPTGGRVTVLLRAKNGGILEVCDTGPGILENERERVLQGFYRIPGNLEEGSGLGLSIVRRIAELHHATLELSNNPDGQGLRARVIFTAHH
jgi:signal transduction histidine kinase